MCVCKGRQRHAHLLTREINYMCKFRKCTRSWAQTSRQGEWWSLQCKERRQWRKCCHHLLAALWPSDWAPGPGWQDVKKSKAIAKSFSTDWDVSSQFTCFSHSNSPIQLFSGAVILTAQCASAGSQQRGLRPEQHFHLHKSQGNSGGQWATSTAPGVVSIWSLQKLCPYEGKFICCCQKKKKIKLAQATNLQLPPTPWKMADELPPPQPSWPINKTAQKAAEKGRWLLTYLPLC